LLPTQLFAPNKQVVATAQGPVSIVDLILKRKVAKSIVKIMLWPVVCQTAQL